MNEPDPRLVRRAKAGDVEAFEDLVRRYQADVWRFAFHVLRDRALAEDVTQETFIRAFRFLRTFRGDAPFTSWLLRIARNCSVDATRARRHLADVEPPERAEAPQGQARAEIATAIAALGDAHREPFLLIEVFGLSYEETADVLGVRVGTIKSRMHRARKTMMRALAESDEEDAGGA